MRPSSALVAAGRSDKPSSASLLRLGVSSAPAAKRRVNLNLISVYIQDLRASGRSWDETKPLESSSGEESVQSTYLASSVNDTSGFTLQKMDGSCFDTHWSTRARRGGGKSLDRANTRQTTADGSESKKIKNIKKNKIARWSGRHWRALREIGLVAQKERVGRFLFLRMHAAASATAIHNLQQRRQTDVWLFFPCSLALTQVLQLGKTQQKSY